MTKFNNISYKTYLLLGKKIILTRIYNEKFKRCFFPPSQFGNKKFKLE